jgi:phospholipase/carboxylesterase
VIFRDAIEHTEEWLNKNMALTSRTYPGMGHRIEAREMVDVSAFLRFYVLR